MERAHDGAGRLQLRLHPLYADGGVRGRQVERRGELSPRELAGGFEPPQRQEFPVFRAEPAGGLGDLPALPRQAEPQDGQVREVGARVGDVVHSVQAAGGRGPAPAPVVADLTHRDRDEPGAEAVRIAEPFQAVDDAQHRLLDDVVHVRVPVQRAPDDVVDQRQVTGDQPVQRSLVTVPRRHDRLGARPYVPIHPAPLHEGSLCMGDVDQTPR
ncbi:hypothetical protein GCM10029978_039240 [Actinoallomurus acanthiterrae]